MMQKMIFWFYIPQIFKATVLENLHREKTLKFLKK